MLLASPTLPKSDDRFVIAKSRNVHTHDHGLVVHLEDLAGGRRLDQIRRNELQGARM
jgi:hypothetical protein